MVAKGTNDVSCHKQLSVPVSLNELRDPCDNPAWIRK